MKCTFAATLLCLATSTALAQPSLPGAISSPETQTKDKLKVSSPSFTTESILKPRYTAYGDNVSPALRWTVVPGVKSYAIIVEDPDAPRDSAVVHWLMWNIPANVTSLPEGVPRTAQLADPPGARQGKNSAGSIGYQGPRPPAGSPPHHYHFQVFALDIVPNLPGGATREQLLKAIKGHVRAKGDLVGQYAQR